MKLADMLIVVPFGRALDFGPVWDGYDLIREMSQLKCEVGKMLEKYNQVFMQSFGVTKSELPNLKPRCKSLGYVGHMAMVGELEDLFDIEMDIEDIIEISSYEKGKEILSRYGLKF